MATIQELLNLAYEIRDAEQNGENTALRVGQFLVELVNHFNTKADVDNISGAYHLKQQQAPIMALMSVQQMSDSDGQDNKAWWSTDGHIKYQHNGRIYDLGTPAYMLYYCGDKIYKWTGSATGFQLMTDGGSSGGGASVFANFAVAASTNELPDNGIATTGYIVGQNLYAYVGTGGDTKGGKYQNLGGLNAAGVSLTTNNDGTFTIHVGDDSYTINLNHTHENMAKLEIVDEEPADPARDTIYALVNDAEDPSEIQSLWIAGLPFAGGGGTPLLPSLTRPADGSTIPIGYTENGSVSAVINIKGKRLTQPLVVEFASGSTGYSFDTNDVTTNSYYDNNTGKLTIPAADANSVNGVDVVVKFTGNDSDMDAEGVLGISGSSVDGIDADVTLVANPTSADGLIGHWDGDDAAQSGAWVDKVNSMKLNLGGSASKTNDGYQLDNTGAPKNAWLYLDSADKSTMNSEIGKEFTCIVDCLVKFSATGMIANIIDFGVLGTSLSNASIRAYVKQVGEFCHGAKSPTNTLLTPVVNNVQITAFTTGTYVPMRIFCGAKLVNGVQRFFARFGAAEVYSDLATPVAINFSGCTVGNTTADYAFAAGIAYLTNSSANSDTPNYKADVIYERILLFNKTL